jgi:ABC-type polysaccharide transport system permease subunit
MPGEPRRRFVTTAVPCSAGGRGSRPLSLDWALPSIGNIVTWEFVGYNMIIFYSALRVISGELYEAAAIDGAGPFRTIFSIKLPALRGAIVLTTAATPVSSGWEYLPYQLYAETIFSDTAGQAYVNNSDLNDGLRDWQDALVEYGNRQSFSVKAG